jgi:hypothetical protein
MIREQLPGWTLAADRDSVHPTRIDAVSMPLDQLRQKAAQLLGTDRSRAWTFVSPPAAQARSTGSIVVEKDGKQIRVDYLADTFTIIGIQG